MHEGSKGSHRDGLFEVNVGHHDEGGVSTELQVHALEVLCAERAHAPPRGRRTREGDNANVRINDNRLTDVGTSGQHRQETLGQSGLFEDARQNNATGHDGARVGFQDDGVAEGERRRHRANGEDEGKVKRRDDADDPRRHSSREAKAGHLTSQDLSRGV